MGSAVSKHLLKVTNYKFCILVFLPANQHFVLSALKLPEFHRNFCITPTLVLDVDRWKDSAYTGTAWPSKTSL